MRNIEADNMNACSSQFCYLCSSRGDILYRDLKDRLYDTEGKWNFRICSNKQCGFVWLDPIPLEEEVGKAYKNYYTHGNIKELGLHARRKSFLLSFLRKTFYILTGSFSLRKMRMDLFEMYLGNNTKGRLLEVGCGNGLRLARMRGFGWEVEGQEIDCKAAENAHDTYGLSVHLGQLREIGLTNNLYDAIIMVHVIEHAFDPLVMLRECYRLLKRGGTLICVTPNIESYGHKYFRSSWFHLDPPRHLSLYSPKSMKYLLGKIGLKNYDIFTTPANADSTYSGSRNIRIMGRHYMNPPVSLSAGIREMTFQRKALAAYKNDSFCGEEMVIRLMKNT